ncbi:hypothetical protein OYT88_08505 [Sporolactobacillus sp. CQH2019]|uniref:hypothetical protein n=1 Tax=Sporolactobacillus sp. CQH2019 TaxID=3023512 RepID=UPI002367E32D|nr:hypothetical protein [Sporolactobacillus sp. CQH2019]MDD9148587.1 hypothetical protein [Sporolactobacillus sp. CQH2019]
MAKKRTLIIISILIIALAAISWQVFRHFSLSAKPQPVNKMIASMNWQNNGQNNEYVTQLYKGSPVTKTIKGTVKTDTDCKPDQRGISRCHNQIQLQNNSKITVITIHNMQHFKCFSPGNKVSVGSLNDKWVKISKLK